MYRHKFVEDVITAATQSAAATAVCQSAQKLCSYNNNYFLKKCVLRRHFAWFVTIFDEICIRFQFFSNVEIMTFCKKYFYWRRWNQEWTSSTLTPSRNRISASVNGGRGVLAVVSINLPKQTEVRNSTI